MATLATTATESLQCIACAIRQEVGGTITVADITDFFTNRKERQASKNAAIMNAVKIPSNAIPFLMRWYESGTEMSEMLESEYQPSKFKTREEQEEYDEMMDTLELRELIMLLGQTLLYGLLINLQTLVILVNKRSIYFFMLIKILVDLMIILNP